MANTGFAFNIAPHIIGIGFGEFKTGRQGGITAAIVIVTKKESI
jgi:hypothetical protein